MCRNGFHNPNGISITRGSEKQADSDAPRPWSARRACQVDEQYAEMWRDRARTRPLARSALRLSRVFANGQCGGGLRGMACARAAASRAMRLWCRHRRPSPQAETIDVAHDQAIAKCERRVDVIGDLPAGAAERVVRDPACASGGGIGRDIGGNELEVLATPAKHRLHRGHALGVERGKNGIGEGHLRVIAGEHARGVAACERGIEPLDQRGVGGGSAERVLVRLSDHLTAASAHWTAAWR